MPRLTGRQLNQEWGVGAQHALYREDGKWYHRLGRFPAALFDARGFVRFENEHEYAHCPGLQIGKELHVPAGISSLPSYVRRH